MINYDLNDNTLKALRFKMCNFPLLDINAFKNIYRFVAFLDDRLNVDWNLLEEIDTQLQPLHNLIYQYNIDNNIKNPNSDNVIQFVPSNTNI